ncbi:ABC transporter family substrate-binding protein [Streptomyces bohaiensis]
MSGRPSKVARPRRGDATRRTAALLAGALLAPLLAACGTGDDTDELPPAHAVAAADRAALTEGGTLTWAVDAMPATLNAFQRDADEVTDRVAQAVLPMLHTLDEQGRPVPNPDFLVSAEVTAREPRQSVVYVLNPEARWSDGRPLSADDLVAQWKALAGRDNAYWSARNAGYDRIDSVEPGDADNEVRVTFTKPYADWRGLFSPLYPQAVTEDPDVFNKGVRDTLEVGAGPFLLESVDRRAGHVVLARNEDWWGDRALLDRLVLAAVPHDQRLRSLAAGRLHVAEVTAAEADRITAADREEHQQAAPGASGSAADLPEPGREGTTDPDDGLDGAAAPAAAPDSAPALLRHAEAQLAARTEPDARAARRLQLRAAEAADAHAEAVAAGLLQRDAAFDQAEQRIFQGLSEVGVHRAYAPAYTQLAVNGTSPALKDERVRWALARGLDREAIARAVHGPAGLPVGALGSHFWVLGQDGYQDTSAGLGETGAETAAAQLDAAGWRRGPVRPPADPGDDTVDAKTGTGAAAAAPVRLGATVAAAQQRAAVLRRAAAVAGEVAAEGRSAALAEPAELTLRASREADAAAEELARSAAAAVRVKAGAPLSLRFVVPDGPRHAETRRVGEQIADQLAAMGVHAELVEVAADRYLTGHVVPGNFDLALYSWPASAFPATDARGVFAKPQGIPGGELFIEQNYARVGTDHIDQLLTQAAGELDDERRAELLAKADTRIWAAAGSLPLYQAPQLVASADEVAGVGAFGLGTPRYQDIGFRG